MDVYPLNRSVDLKNRFVNKVIDLNVTILLLLCCFFSIFGT